MTETTASSDLAASSKEENAGPIPMSFPAVLRSRGLPDNPYAHLLASRTQTRPNPASNARLRRRDDNEGKRWIRRKENARFLHNPHIVAATKRDLSVELPQGRSTFPEPLPSYLQRSTPVPEASLPIRHLPSANAGRFSTSLKGARKELKRCGFRVEMLVQQIESEVLDWLGSSGTVLSPESPDGLSFPGTPLFEGLDSIREVSRTPLQLVWHIPDDSQARFIVHLTARYHEIISFSKDTVTPHGSERLTYLLRPNVKRPDFRATMTLDTPPTTDMDYASHLDESDFVSESDSDLDGPHNSRPLDSVAPPTLAPISESRPASPATSEGWSPIEGSDLDGDESAVNSEAGEDALSASVDSLSINDSTDLDDTPKADRVASARRPAVWTPSLRQQVRSHSSPSRSPSRRPPRPRRAKRPLQRNLPALRMDVREARPTFYEYIFM